MDGGTFATGLAVGLFLGGIGGAFAAYLFTVASESRQRSMWPDVSDESRSERELERVLGLVPLSTGDKRSGRKGNGRRR